jgi:hypothetical protein
LIIKLKYEQSVAFSQLTLKEEKEKKRKEKA